IYPTPVIGMVGVVENVDHITQHAFRRPGDAVVLLGTNTDELGGSEYLYVTAGLVAGAPPRVDLLGERSLQQAVLALIQGGKVQSAHDCSDGGLACTLAESALGAGEVPLGFEVELVDDLPPVALLFGEAQGRIVISCAPGDVEAVLALAADHEVPARRIGTVGEPDAPMTIRMKHGSVSVAAAAALDAYFGAIPGIMDAPATAGA
ncbi:MAG TPA: AIR synthase-related protein, partial [Longimicrobiales bacterium]|nr:AIR synthase-related protein [Longimicrobiales bacterium]